jgi:hypothetical protein
MLEMPRYFVLRERRMTLEGRDENAHYGVEKMECSPDNREIMGTAMVQTAMGAFSFEATTRVATDGRFETRSEDGSFQARGTLYGPPGRWTVRAYDEAVILRTSERFRGHYLYGDRVTAVKVYSAVASDVPLYFMVQLGYYISAEAFERLYRHPEEIAATWERLDGPAAA